MSERMRMRMTRRQSLGLAGAAGADRRPRRRQDGARGPAQGRRRPRAARLKLTLTDKTGNEKTVKRGVNVPR